MKSKTLLSVLALSIVMSAFSQKPILELTFTAENNGQFVPLDSIQIENLTQGGDTTLYAPDTVLVLNYLTSIGDNEDIEENTFSVSQNYPNPFSGKTTIDLLLPEKEHIKVTVRDVLGSEVANYENGLIKGNHAFSFYSGSEKYYLLTVTGNQTSKTIRMLNANSKTIYSGKCKIVYNGFKNTETGFKETEVGVKFLKNIENFEFSLGDELKLTTYTDVEITEMVQTPTESQTYTFEYDRWTPCPEGSVVTDIDGNVYNTVLIGSQCWMKENLKTTTYQNGTAIPNVTDGGSWANLTSGAYVWYDNNISWKDLYGGLYNWYTTIDPNGLCPIGWHVPTNDEWTALTDFIGGTGHPHGNELKSCRQVNSPQSGVCNTSKHPRWDESSENGTDDYGFSAIPSGDRGYDGVSFFYIGTYDDWWSSTEESSDHAWDRFVGYNNGAVGMYDYNKGNGFSVRCLRD